MTARLEPTDPARVSFVVIGKPEPAGSKRGFIRGGKVAIVDANAKSKPWKLAVAVEAAGAMQGRELLRGPVGLAVVFTVRRPKGHYGIHGVRAGAPAHPITRPDCTKLLRGLEDALTGVVWNDDAQVVEQSICKRYGEPEGATVAVFEL